MKLVKICGLAALAMLVALAIGGPSASATELCKVEEEECSAESLYPSATAFKASATKVVLESSLATVICNSTMAGETTASVGSPLPGIIDALSFSSCSMGETACTVEALNLPYFAQLEETAKDKGTFELWGDASSAMTLSLLCGKIIKCKYSVESMTFELKGGKTAEVIASKVPVEKGEGFLCPKTGSFTATYTVSAPEPMHVEKRPTKLCKVKPEGATCPAGEGFSGELKGYLPGMAVLKIVGTGTEASGTVTCTEAPMVLNFTSDGRGKVESLEMKSGGGQCSSNLNGGTPTVAATMDNLPWNRSSISYAVATGPQGGSVFWGTRNPKLKMVVNGTTCIYILRFLIGNIYNPVFFTPLVLKSPNSFSGTRVSGLTNVCPANVTFEAEWWVETSGSANVWVARQ